MGKGAQDLLWNQFISTEITNVCISQITNDEVMMKNILKLFPFWKNTITQSIGRWSAQIVICIIVKLAAIHSILFDLLTEMEHFFTVTMSREWNISKVFLTVKERKLLCNNLISTRTERHLYHKGGAFFVAHFSSKGGNVYWLCETFPARWHNIFSYFLHHNSGYDMMILKAFVVW